MNMKTLVTLTAIAVVGSTTAVRAENISHTRQLLSTKSCPNCELSNAGLVMGDFSGAKLNGANLVGANLSRANLMGADLRGANLTGASFYGADLRGADLRGANITGADLRSAYLQNANVAGLNLQVAYIQGTYGLPTSSGNADDFYRLAYAEWTKNDYATAVERYSQAISLKPKFAGAYLGRAMAKYRLRDDRGAMGDALMAERLFGADSNFDGVRSAQAVIKGIQVAGQPTPVNSNAGTSGNIMDLLTGVGSLLFSLF
jgi:tetratricopeptide (TPR) repeat protein